MRYGGLPCHAVATRAPVCRMAKPPLPTPHRLCHLRGDAQTCESAVRPPRRPAAKQVCCTTLQRPCAMLHAAFSGVDRAQRHKVARARHARCAAPRIFGYVTLGTSWGAPEHRRRAQPFAHVPSCPPIGHPSMQATCPQARAPWLPKSQLQREPTNAHNTRPYPRAGPAKNDDGAFLARHEMKIQFMSRVGELVPMPCSIA